MLLVSRTFHSVWVITLCVSSSNGYHPDDLGELALESKRDSFHFYNDLLDYLQELDHNNYKSYENRDLEYSLLQVRDKDDKNDVSVVEESKSQKAQTLVI